MTLPASGPIAVSDINTELTLASDNPNTDLAFLNTLLNYRWSY